MLHKASAAGGLGFCHPALPGLLPSGHHGPLVVALDSNILIDLQQHGSELLDEGSLTFEGDATRGYLAELAALADLLNLWLLRDIRFVVTPASKTDAKKAAERMVAKRQRAIDALANSLAFQLGDWGMLAPSERPAPVPIGDETGLPPGPDRDLVLEAQAVGAHVFLTRDEEVLSKTVLTGPFMAVRSPSALMAEFASTDVQPFFGGTCGGAGCPYEDWAFLAPDLGKLDGLLSILDESGSM